MRLAHVRVLETCRKVEEGAAKLYHLLADQHRHEPGIAALWKKTAREEENHAQQVALVRRREQVAASVKVDPVRAEQALALVHSVIEACQAQAPSIPQALEEAITLEHTLAQFHADFAVEFTDPAYQQLFRSMMAADKEHVGALQAALERLVDRSR